SRGRGDVQSVDAAPDRSVDLHDARAVRARILVLRAFDLSDGTGADRLLMSRNHLCIEPLPWDSEFFGFPIGRVALDDATPEALLRLDADARELGMRCLYGSVDASPGTTALLVQEFGHRLVEVSQAFSRPPMPFTPPPTAATVRRGTLDDIPLLEGAFEALAP